MVIYKITNILDGKFYIGKTIGNPYKRFERHCRRSSRCPKLLAAIKKHGRENFTLNIIDEATTHDELNNKEIYWINCLDAIANGYNLTKGGDGGMLSNETKQKLSNLRLGKTIPEIVKLKMSIDRTGSKNSNSKKVVVIFNNQERLFGCLKEAADFYNVKYSTAKSIAQGHNSKTRSGIVFKYIEEIYE